MSVDVKYKGATITTVEARETKTLTTAGKYCEADIVLTDDSNPVAEENDVIFIDYDGTIRYSYTADEFLALTELPPNPTHAGLTAQGWNWTLADAKDYVSAYGGQIIGQNYITDDGKTRLYLTIYDAALLEVRISLLSSIAGGVSIDWGDGSAAEVTTSTARTEYTHTYPSTGDYMITLTVARGTLRLAGWYSGDAYNMFGNSSSERVLTRVEIGAGITTLGYATFKECKNLTTCTVPTSLTSFSDNYIFSTTQMMAFTLPPGVSAIGYQMFQGGSRTIRYCSVPKSVTNIGGYTFSAAQAFRRFYIPNGVAVIGTQTFYDTAMVSIIVPPSVTQIGSLAMTHLIIVHLRPTTPPTLDNSNAFSAKKLRTIYVPYSDDHSVLAAYQAATNWSNFASYMQEEPQ